MNGTAVRDIREKTETMLQEAPRSRDSVERHLRQEGYSEEDIAAALDETDWMAQALAIADQVLVRKSSGPHDLIKRLFVAGFTEQQVADARAHYDWSELIKARSELLLRAPLSRVMVRTTLLNLGFSPEETEQELDRFDQAFWEQQAQRAMKAWLEQWDSREPFDPRGMLRERGFTPVEVAYAVDNMNLSMREAAQREAQSMYEEGVSLDGTILALEFAGFSESDAVYAATNVVKDGRSVYERRVESYMKRPVRSEEGLLEVIGTVPADTLRELYEKYNLGEVDWVEISREEIRRRLTDWREGREHAAERLLVAGYTKPQINAALDEIDWEAVAAEAAQRYVDDMEAFSPDDLREALYLDDFTDSEVEAAVSKVVWPADYPDDVDIAWLRRLYIQPALRDEALEYLVLRGRPEECVRATLDELGLDWSRPLQMLADQWFNVQEAISAATPRMLRERLQGHVTVQLDEDPSKSVTHDWNREAIRMAQEMKEQGCTETIVLRALYDEEFPPQAIAAATEAERLGNSFGPDAAAEHLETLLRSTRFSRAGIEAELQALGYTPDLIAEAQRRSGLDLGQVDWRKRALQWIRAEGQEYGLSKEGMRAALREQGFDKNDITWAIGKHKANYAENAAQFAERLLEDGAPPERLSMLLERARFTRAEIAAAMKTLKA